MIKRILRVLAFISAIIFSPAWLIIWIFTKRAILFELMEYAIPSDDELD